MADELDWSLNEDAAGRVIMVLGSDRFDLGPRDNVFVRLADFMGDGLDQPEGYDDHEDVDVEGFGETK